MMPRQVRSQGCIAARLLLGDARRPTEREETHRSPRPDEDPTGLHEVGESSLRLWRRCASWAGNFALATCGGLREVFRLVRAGNAMLLCKRARTLTMVRTETPSSRPHAFLGFDTAAVIPTDNGAMSHLHKGFTWVSQGFAEVSQRYHTTGKEVSHVSQRVSHVSQRVSQGFAATVAKVTQGFARFRKVSQL